MQRLINRIEGAIHRDVGRGMDAVFAATRGGLWNAASALAGDPCPNVGFITGFYIVDARSPAAETDGPAAAALLAAGLLNAGIDCRLATDTPCRSACRVALDQAGAGRVAVDALAPDGAVEALVDHWRSAGINWVIAIERCGPAADGRARTMRGTDVSASTAPLHRLFNAGLWRTIAIGDGGNELGMGSVSAELISQHVKLGDAIGCVVPAEHLIAAGVSHWGAYAMLAALAALRPEWSTAMRAALDPSLDRAIITAMVRDGPAVDGVSLKRESTIDALGMEAHHAVLRAIRALLDEYALSPQVTAVPGLSARQV